MSIDRTTLQKRLAELLPADFSDKPLSGMQILAITATVENLLAEENE